MLERIHTTEVLKTPPTVVYVCGLPGTGKTTAGRIAAEKSGAIMLPEFYETIPEWVIATRRDDPIERRVAAQMWSLEQHRQKNNQLSVFSGKAIVDRTWVDSLVYAHLYGPDVAEMIEMRSKQTEWVAGKTILLTAHPSVLRDRLQKRMSMSNEDWYANWQEFIIGLKDASELVAAKFNIPLIDTSDLSVQKVSERIICQMKPQRF